MSDSNITQSAFEGSGVCKCGHDKGAHTRQVNDDGSCTMCNCKKFEDRDLG